MEVHKKIIFALVFLLLLHKIADAHSMHAYQYYNSGIQHYRNGKVNEAIQAFTNAVSISPSFADAHYNLGTLYLKTGNIQSASKEFEKVLVINPQDKGARENLAKLSQSLPTQSPNNSLQNTSSTSDEDKIVYVPVKSLQTVSTKPKIQTQRSLRTVYTGLDNPTGMTADLHNNIYIASYSENTLTKISPDGKRELVKTKYISGPIGLAIDNFNNIYVASYNNGNVVVISSRGEESILTSGLNKPYGLLLHNQKLYISEQGTNNVTALSLTPKE